MEAIKGWIRTFRWREDTGVNGRPDTESDKCAFPAFQRGTGIEESTDDMALIEHPKTTRKVKTYQERYQLNAIQILLLC